MSRARGMGVPPAPVLVAWDEGPTDKELETDAASAILSLLDALDGRDRTLVTVHREAAHASVGGDATSGVVVYVSPDGETFHQLTFGPTSDEQVEVVAGGQPGRYPRHAIVELAAAKQAIATFLSRGVPDEALTWEQS